ncbi:class I SAM-dependent methyltransferase [Thalassobacillus pellis]|uniref:class I SAM-dependent methyltransferase n=1 Tax=Thalassobacillus pellis TaxID=748008 RepID=UPI0019619165|nr:class I SAM-dependent methyltransferase [Thalassobacillus pellis]MBM7554763.1 16S rRNA C1402 N4-methylase RsmH [Thalassobacillus pellis]
MTLERVLDFAHNLLKTTLKQGDVAIDATCGNGHDTLLLSKLVGGDGHIYSFDIQEKAIDTTRKRLDDSGVTNTTLIHDSHDQISNYLPKEHFSGLKGAIFNLGYLPGSDKNIITKPNTTIEALDQLLTFIQPGGIVVLVVYHGHHGGKTEKDALIEYVTGLDQQGWHVLQYNFINQKNDPPFVIAIEKS